jgi:hypothetical protein
MHRGGGAIHRLCAFHCGVPTCDAQVFWPIQMIPPKVEFLMESQNINNDLAGGLAIHEGTL